MWTRVGDGGGGYRERSKVEHSYCEGQMGKIGGEVYLGMGERETLRERDGEQGKEH